jgi:hypothetical protein
MILVDELNLAEDAVLERLNRYNGTGSKTACLCTTLYCAVLKQCSQKQPVHLTLNKTRSVPPAAAVCWSRGAA